MTQSINNRVRTPLLGNESGRPLDTTVNSGNINSGDLCYWTGNGVASFGNGPLTFNNALVTLLEKILGVSRDTNPLTVGGIVGPIETVGVDHAGEFSLNTTSGDTYVWDSEVTIGTDAQTVTLASNYSPAAPTCALSTTAASAINGLPNAQHGVALAWLTPLGWTTTGAATNGATTLTTSGDPSISVTVPAFPSYALACGIFVDGLLSEVVTAAGTYTISGWSTALVAAPTENALAIGRVRLDNQPFGVTSIAGGSGVQVNVALNVKFPHSSLQ